tara:strand:- start:316 stop:516 length:201 start_codon:yes stop_codon:yes gene_type:complete
LQDRLLFAKVDIGVTESPTKAAKEEEEQKMGLGIFFHKWQACASRFHRGIFIFSAAEKPAPYFGGV